MTIKNFKCVKRIFNMQIFHRRMNHKFMSHKYQYNKPITYHSSFIFCNKLKKGRTYLSIIYIYYFKNTIIPSSIFALIFNIFTRLATEKIEIYIV